MRKICKYLRYQFRYKLSSVFIILGMVVGILALYNGIGIFEYIKNYTNDLRGNEYGYTTIVEMSSTKEINLKKYLIECDSIIRMDYVNAYVDEKKVTCLMTVLLEANEKTNYKLISGRLPSEEEKINNEKVVAVGQKRSDAIYYKDKKQYITLSGEEYLVTGIVGTEKSDLQDYLLITYYDCLGENILKEIDKYSYYLVVESNNESINSDINSIAALSSIDNIDTSISKVNKIKSGLSIEEKNSISTYIIIFGFALLNCILIARFWIYQRKKEVAILLILGFGKIKILNRLIKEMIFHVFCIFLIAAILQIGIEASLGSEIIYEVSVINIFLMGAAIILLCICIVISPAIEIMKNPPIYEINGGKE